MPRWSNVANQLRPAWSSGPAHQVTTRLSKPAADTETGPAGASLSVSNTGAVIPLGEIGRLFQPFQQLGRERIRASGADGLGASGHGLGLAIVQAIVTAHGAALTTAAHPGGGLDITVTFRSIPD
jgi:signal transduction histidine kinase